MTQTAALQPYTGEEEAMQERLTLLKNYNPKEHLITISSKQGGQKPYYPAAWRLYELRLKHPHITIESEIVHMDQEHNLVVVKAWIFDGKTYAESEQRASAYKQGQLSMLDKVETAAKARAARDLGVSTELALDMEDATIDTPPPDTDQPTDGKTVNATLVRSVPVEQNGHQSTNGNIPHLTSAYLRQKAKSLGYDERQFRQGVCTTLKLKQFPKEFTAADLHKINNVLDEVAKERAAGGGR